VTGVRVSPAPISADPVASFMAAKNWSSPGSYAARFVTFFRPSRLTHLALMLNSVRFFPSWAPTSLNQVHGLIAMIRDIESRTTRHSVWVECGSPHGESAGLILAFPFIEKLHCIDVYASQVFAERLKPFLQSGRCEFHHGTSRQCVAGIAEVDVAYIDADHSYEAVKDDIAVWYPRVAAGGALCGHDYYRTGKTWPGVSRAVNEFVAEHGLTLNTYADSSWMVLKGS
jgi:hypothetical protein